MKTPTRSLADIRVVIGAVLSIIGLFLLVCSAFLNGPDETAKTGGVNANLWSGLGLVAIAVLMTLWWAVESRGESGNEGAADTADTADTAGGEIEQNSR
ncbi:hypothetical protein [Actinomyces massiliensis]|uniref:hypothetical protein n=1 Tax=Actinomyces massiliensis TaxID=461393 RepID=UPI0028F0DA07|nr:hypothetical protein [Actinomyces massiliensis]